MRKTLKLHEKLNNFCFRIQMNPEKLYSGLGKIVRLTLVDIAAFLTGERLMSHNTKKNGIPERE